MTQPDRPAPIDPADESWPDQDDPEATRVVRRDQPFPGGDDAPVTQRVSEPPAGDPATPSGGFDRPDPDAAASGADQDGPAGYGAHRAEDQPLPDGGQAAGQASPDAPATPGWPGSPTGAPPAPAPGSGPQPAYRPDGPGSFADSEPTTAVPPYQPSDQAATSYLGAPTAAYPGPGSTGPQDYAQPAGYSYQQPPSGYQQAAMPSGPVPSGPQFIPAPAATASVTLPPVRMPKAESRVAINILGSIVGLILLAGGLTLIMLFQGKVRRVDGADVGDLTGSGAALAGSIDALSLVLVIVGALLIALAALLTAWSSWAAILPGFLLAAASVWAMITTGPNSGGRYIADGTRWAFSDDQFALFCIGGMGLLTGLVLLLAGLAAVFLRAGVRRTIRQQLESIQS